MQVLVIPDVHLKPAMFTYAARIMRQHQISQAVCLMDLPDDWDQKYNVPLYEETFDAAIDFARAFPDTLWCWGNHELSYLLHHTEAGISTAADYTVLRKIKDLQGVLPDRHQIGYVPRIGCVLFSHAGLADSFVRRHVRALLYHNADAVISRINRLRPEKMWTDDSPVLFRPQYTAQPLYRPDQFLHAVGHTTADKVMKKGNLLSCDNFSTFPARGDAVHGEFPVVNTETGDHMVFPV